MNDLFTTPSDWHMITDRQLSRLLDYTIWKVEDHPSFRLYRLKLNDLPFASSYVGSGKIYVHPLFTQG